MARVQLTKEMILADKLNPWMPVAQTVREASRGDKPVKLPQAALFLQAVTETDGAMCNGGWVLALEDYTPMAVRSVEGFRFFELNKHAALVARALKWFDDLGPLDDEDPKAEALIEKLNDFDTRYGELDGVTDAVERMVLLYPDRFVFDVEV